MRGTELYQLAGSVASQSTSALNKVFYEEYHKEMDNMFARLHAEQEIDKEGLTRREYKQQFREKVDNYLSERQNERKNDNVSERKYQRLEFSTLTEANTFAQSMREQGFDVINPSIALEGKFLMEVPTSIPKLDKDGNQELNAKGEPARIELRSAMAYAAEQTGVEATPYSLRDKDREQNRLTDRPEEAVGNEVSSFFMREMLGNELGTVVNAVKKMDMYSRKYGDDNQQHAFTTELKVTEGKERGTGSWSGANYRQVEATVLNGSVVVINGNIVEDEKVAKKILNKHEERAVLADKYINKDGFASQFRFSSTNEKIKANAEAIQSSIKKQSYATGDVKSGRFNGGVLDSMRDSYGLAAVALRQNSKREMTDDLLSVLNKAGSHIHLSATETEFIQKMNDKGPGSMTYDDVINATGILKRMDAKDGKKSFLSEDERKLVQRAVGENGSFLLSKSESNMVNTNIKRELDAIREDLGVDLRFRDIHGSTLTSMQLIHIDKEFESKLASAGIRYDESKGKFVKNGTELNKEEFLKELKVVDPKLAKDVKKNLETKGYKIKDDGSFVHFHKGITEDDILKLDRAFIAKAEAQGYNFITATGKFDVESLKNLSDTDLKKIGISKETQKALIDFHSGEWGEHNFNLTKTVAGGFANLTVKLTSGGGLIGEGDRETAEAINTYQKMASVPNKVKETAKYTEQAAQAVKTKIDVIKEKHYGSGSANPKPQNPHAPKKEVKASKRKSNKKKSEKYLSKQEKLMLKKSRSQKRWAPFSKLRQKLDFKQRAYAAFAKTPIGKFLTGAFNKLKALAIKAVAGFLGIYLLFSGVVIGIVILMSTIQALLNVPYEGGKKIANWIGSFTGDDRPAVVVLYETLNDSQNAWVSNLGKYEHYYDCRDGINYTNAYRDYTTYLNSLSQEKLSQLGVTSDDNYFILKEDGGLTINPFYGIPTSDIELKGNTSANHNKSFYNTVTSYDGQNDTQILANASVFNVKQDSSLGKGYVSIENGHTNNIKDILSMVDVMFEYELDKFGDDEIASALGGSVASLKYDNGYETFINGTKAVGNIIVESVKESAKKFINFFLPKEEEVETNGWPKWDDYYNGGGVKWGTLQNYCYFLFEASHQEQATLDVDFYDIKKFEVNVAPAAGEDGTMTSIINPETGLDDSWVSQETASWLGKDGICVSPVRSDFRIAYNGGKVKNQIYPYLEGADEKIYDLSMAKDNNYAKFNLTMEDCVSSITKRCLWSGMGNDKKTYDAISKLGGCWQLKSSNKHCKKGDPVKYSGDFLGGEWFDKVNDAEKDVREDFNAYIAAEIDKLSEVYTLSNDRNSMTKDYYENDKSYTVTTKTRNVFDHNDMVDANWGSFKNTNNKYYSDRMKDEINDNNGLKPESEDGEDGRPAYKLIIKGQWEDSNGKDCYDVLETIFLDNWDMGNDIADDQKTLRCCNSYINDDDKWVFEGTYWLWNDKCWHDIKIETDVWYKGWGTEIIRLQTNDPQSKTQYQGVITDGTMYQTYTDTYTRECEGHPFEYCGGHVACHSYGVVYSTTNEQLSAVSMYSSEDVKPQALYDSSGAAYSLLSDEANDSYSPIRGKVVKKDVDYTTLATAATSGGAATVFKDVQGVGPNVSPGLNFYLDGDELGSGFKMNNVPISYARDIFDIDCLILKGDNIFPWRVETDETGKLKEPRWRKYEGWTADNISFVSMRVSNDWYELYGFDIPMEIEGNTVTTSESSGDIISVSGVQCLTENDVKTIVEKLTDKYGDEFTEERQEAVKFALHWVGRGHFSNSHKEHNFLSQTCVGRTYEYSDGHSAPQTTTIESSCTASNSEGFVNYYLSKFNKEVTDDITDWQNGWGSLKPADIYREGNLKFSEIPFLEDEVKSDDWINTYLDLTGVRDKIYGVYIGTFDEDIELECGQQLTAGVPVTVCLAPSSSRTGAGSVYLKSEKSDGYGITGPTQQYLWLIENVSQKQWHSFD